MSTTTELPNAEPSDGLRYHYHLPEMVRRSLPLARRAALEGILEGENDRGGCGLPARLQTLAGFFPETGDTVEDFERFEQWTYAAFAFGIAVGLQLRESTFTGGAK
jgi:hypothetical protein